jgi:hypothetical protein
MKVTRTLTVFLAILSIFGLSVNAQKSKKPTTKKTTTSTKTSTMPPLEVRAARVKVSNQLSNVDQFVKLLAPVAQNIEDLDSQARTKKIAQSSMDTNEANKKKVIAAMRGLRDGLVSLEGEFKTKPDLKKYLPNIQGIADLAAQAQDSALAGKFVASLSPLQTISQKLSDTLRLMPDAEL